MSKIANLWRIEDLRKRIIYTVLILLVYRLGCNIPVPGIDASIISSLFETSGLTQYLNIVSGGALAQCAVFALGIAPYINTSIIFELLAVSFPKLGELRKDPDKYHIYRKYVAIATLVMALIMAYTYYSILRSQGALQDTGIFTAVVIHVLFITGSMASMWLGSKIDDNGIGNGASLLIFAGIISRWSYIIAMVQMAILAVQLKAWITIASIVFIFLFSIAAIVYVVYMTGAERRIHVSYGAVSKGSRTVRRRATYIPLKLIFGGVMPIIFANTLLSVPATIGYFIDPAKHPNAYQTLTSFTASSWLYIALYVLLIYAMNAFYIGIQFDPIEVSNNLRQNGGMIPGYRPGRPTSDYIRNAMSGIAPAGSFALALVAVVPMLVSKFTGLSMQLGGTSLIIICSVCIDLITSIDSYASTRNYEGFIR